MVIVGCSAVGILDGAGVCRIPYKGQIKCCAAEIFTEKRENSFLEEFLVKTLQTLYTYEQGTLR